MHKNKFLTVGLAVLFLSLNSVAFAGGTLTGTAKYEGETPKLKRIKMDADPICLSKHNGQEVVPPTVVLGEGNTLGNVFVYIKSGLSSQTYPPATKEAVIDQGGCQYHPHVLG